MNKIAVIQARMSSSRLPGKVLMDIAGRPMLEHVLIRTMKARSVDDIVVATTTDPSDDVLEQFCHNKGIPCYRGSLPDVLDRMYRTAAQIHADVVIRLTADCPLIDAALIDLTVAAFLGRLVPKSPSTSTPILDAGSQTTDSPDFAANRLPPPWQRTLPIGLDVEVCSFNALERAWKQADQIYQREHVMPYLYEGVIFTSSDPPAAEWYIQQGTTPRNFHIALLNHQPDYGSLRWTVDTSADLEFVRQVYAHLDAQTDFNWQDILALLERKPGLAAINADVQHKTAFDIDERSPHIQPLNNGDL
jgi:spore coat polysaccharide biosynthesis protein SpsF